MKGLKLIHDSFYVNSENLSGVTINSLSDLIDGLEYSYTKLNENWKFNDVQAATIRTWNANLAAWCLSNNATLIPTHDAMGKIRVSTGQLDDLKTEYDADGTHITQLGVLKMAEIMSPYIK